MIKKREQSVHKIKWASKFLYKFPDWYYDSKKEAKEKQICFYCWTESRKMFCSKECVLKWRGEASLFIVGLASLRREIHKKYWFVCQLCWEIFRKQLPSGIWIPVYKWESHHIEHLEDWWEDTFDNQHLLCHDCHAKQHENINFFKTKKWKKEKSLEIV